MDSGFIKDGQMLGYEGQELKAYVEKSREAKKIADEQERADRKRQEELQREERLHQREVLKLQAELEAAKSLSSNGENSSTVEKNCFIKLTSYRDGDDIAVYLQTFERVREANGWSAAVAMSALQNGFANSQVCSFVNSLPSDLAYSLVKQQIIEVFGFTIYSYQQRFRTRRQGRESYRQFVINLSEDFEKFCELAETGEDVAKLKELMIKEQMLNSASRNLSEYLREHDIFKTEFEKVVKMADNYQAIHGKEMLKQSSPVNVNHNFRKSCHLCGKTGHMARFCKMKKQSSGSLDSPGEFPSLTPFENMRNGETARPKHPAKLKCFHCGGEGHIARNCIKEKQQQQVDAPSSGNLSAAMNTKCEVPYAELEVTTVKEEPIDWHQGPQEAMNTKSEVPHAELEDISVKEEPIDWHQEPQASLSRVSSTVPFKKEVNDIFAEARSEHAEAEHKPREGSSELYNCELCNFSSVYKRSLHNHNARKHGCSDVLNCGLCDYSTACKSDLRVHQASKHSIGKLFNCEMCDYSAAFETALKTHQVSKHSIGKLFKCEVCDYSTASKRNLKSHQASKHSICKPFKCEVCDYSTTVKFNLKGHQASKHGIGKLFKCDSCDYSIAFKSSLKAHQASKHNICKPFKCEMCDYSTAVKRNLKGHQASIHGIGKLFQCEMCDYSNGFQSNLKAHQAKKHSMSKLFK